VRYCTNIRGRREGQVVHIISNRRRDFSPWTRERLKKLGQPRDSYRITYCGESVNKEYDEPPEGRRFRMCMRCEDGLARERREA
jgi:hypothetical protein